MKTNFDVPRIKIAEKVFQQISKMSADPTQPLGTLSEIDDALGAPPQPELGDFALGCFIFAKKLKKSPALLAQELAQTLAAETEFTCTAAGPYLNFKFKPEFFGPHVLEPILTGENFTKTLSVQNPKTMIEYSQPNTHKELHVGHMRNMCLGDALVKMLRYSGHTIVSTTFAGDVGTHVAKCLWYMKFHNQEPEPTQDKGEWLGKLYSKAHLKLEDEIGTPQEAINREQLTVILKELEAHKGEYYDLWKKTRQWSIDLMQQVYDWAKIKFDIEYWESDVDASSVQYAQKLFKEGKLIQSEGAIGLDLSEDKLGFCMLLKTDGTGLYATKDVELARRKFQDHHIEKSIYVVDVRQALHFKQVFKTLEVIGFKEAAQCYHLQYNFVELPDGAMSSRKGNIIPLMDLISKMEQTIKDNYLSRYQQGTSEDWSASEIQETASRVAKGAIRYGMLKMDTNKKIVFDMNEWLKLDGDSGPFIQYSYARIASLLRKFSFTQKTVNSSHLVHAAEGALLQHLMNFNTITLMAAESYKPASLCAYLYDLAKKFNTFYHDCPIGTAPTEELKQARLALAAATGETLKKGLELLGIPVPDRM